MTYEILIRISLGDNFPLQDEYLSKDCRTCVYLEAKFNDETLQSDPIEITSPNPELATELGFRLNKKDFQQYRIERKSVKLQCYIDYSTLDEREYIGYAILHLRDAHDYTPSPKFVWNVLLNPKYKGHAGKRPQLYLAFMVNKLKDETELLLNSSFAEILNDSIENHISSPLKRPNDNNADMIERSMTRSMISSSLLNEPEYDANLKVKYKNKLFYIWDENKYTEGSCNQMFLVQVQLERPENLLNLFGDKTYKQLEHPSPFYFRYTLFGKQIRSKDFLDIFHYKDFKKHKCQFPILTISRHVLKRYFELYPTLEVQFCMGDDCKIIGFVTLNLLRLFENHTGNIGADYMIVPEDENVFVKEPFPVVNVAFSICKKDHAKLITDLLTSSSKSSATGSDNNADSTSVDSSLSYGTNMSHYYIAIDLRSIRLCGLNRDELNDSHILLKPFYLQFNYAFFGIVDNVKTYPSIQFIRDSSSQASLTIPHGFCGFNFATCYDKLEYTFNEIPFIVQLISAQDDTLLGTAKLDLSLLLKKANIQSDVRPKSGELGDNFVNTFVHVYDEINDKICEIQVVMFLQDIQNISLCADHADKTFDRQSSSSTVNVDCKSKILNNLNEMIIDTAHDIETWKEEQMKLFKNKLKQKEQEFLNSLNTSQITTKDELRDMEKNIRSTIENLNDREVKINEKETKIEMRQKELDAKLSRISHEIDQAIYDVRLQYEEKTNSLKNQLKNIEQEKCKIQEKNYFYERKLKERDNKIKELEKELKQFSEGSNSGSGTTLPDSVDCRSSVSGRTSTPGSATLRNRSVSRASSLTRSVSSAPNRRPIVTREGAGTSNVNSSSSLSKSMIENKTNGTALYGRSASAKPPQARRLSSSSTSSPAATSTTHQSLLTRSQYRSDSTTKATPTSSSSLSGNRFGYSTTLDRNHSLCNPRTSSSISSSSSLSSATTTGTSTLTSSTGAGTVHSIRSVSSAATPIEKIKRERMDLIKKGISVKDPLIVEIDRRLKAHRAGNNVRI